MRSRKRIKPHSNRVASRADSTPSWRSPAHNTMVANNRGRSEKAVVLPTTMGEISSVMPNTRPILAMFDPKALPTARLPAPARADINDTRISGAEVPTDTMVMPISRGDMPNDRAIAAAPSIKRSALQTSTVKLMATINKSVSIMSCLYPWRLATMAFIVPAFAGGMWREDQVS